MRCARAASATLRDTCDERGIGIKGSHHHLLLLPDWQQGGLTHGGTGHRCEDRRRQRHRLLRDLGPRRPVLARARVDACEQRQARHASIGRASARGNRGNKELRAGNTPGILRRSRGRAPVPLLLRLGGVAGVGISRSIQKRTFSAASSFVAHTATWRCTPGRMYGFAYHGCFLHRST